MEGDAEMREENMEEAINRIKVLKSELGMTCDEFADYHNKKNPDSAYKLKPNDTYSFRCGWAQAELEYILKLIED